MDVDNYYGQNKYTLITDKSKTSLNNEVTRVYNAFKYQFAAR